MTEEEITMEQHTKKQHYVNQGYLSKFCDETQNSPSLWVYDSNVNYGVDFDKYKHRTKTPAQVCYREYLYEGGGLPLNTVENALGRIETDFGELVNEKIENQLPLTPDDKMKLSLFVAVQEARTIAQKENLERSEDRGIMLVEALEKQHDLPNTKSSEMKQSKADNEMFLMNVSVAVEINKWQAADWLIFEAPDGCPFITSDHPTMLYDFSLMNSFYGIPAFCKTSEMTLAISSKFAVVANHLDIGGYEKASYNQVNEINSRTVMASHQYFYSSKQLEYKDMEQMLNRQRQTLVLDKVAQEKETTLDKRIAEAEKTE